MPILGHRLADRQGPLGESSLPRYDATAGFTLIEIILAAAAAALVLLAVYGIYASALHLRDNATARIRESRLRTHAAAIIRRDLQGALISGGVLAATLEGDSNKQSSLGGSASPGYLKMTTTTGRDTADDLYGDVQQVEYYIAHDAASTTDSRQGGTLVRAITRDLLATATVTSPQEEQILEGVQSIQVAFYDGTTWQETWQANPSTVGSAATGAAATSTTTAASSAANAAAGGTNAPATSELLPQAIRIDIQQSAPTAKDHAPPPLEILIPWTTQPFTAPTPTPTPGR